MEIEDDYSPTVLNRDPDEVVPVHYVSIQAPYSLTLLRITKELLENVSARLRLPCIFLTSYWIQGCLEHGKGLPMLYGDNYGEPDPETTSWTMPNKTVQQHLTSKSTRRDANLSSLHNPRPVYEIPCSIGTLHKVSALGDYCSRKNIMREAVALRCGLPIDRTEVTSVTIGSGAKRQTTGTVTAPFRFYGETKTYWLPFHILPDCIHNVVLGKSFLKATATFSAAANFARRVKRHVANALSKHDLLYLGDNAPRFTGLVNGHRQDALADSGARVMVMDEDYARSINLPLLLGSKYTTKLRFADGSTAMTSGMTQWVNWEFGPGGSGLFHRVQFHILKNAPANVILSDDFLFDTKAFIQYDCFLVDEDDEDDEAYFFAIDVESSPRDFTMRDTQGYQRHAELVRRGKEDDYLAKLPAHSQAEELTKVLERRAAWDAEQSSSNVTHTPSSQGPATGSSSSLSSPNPPQPKLSRWRFKLKRRNA